MRSAVNPRSAKGFLIVVAISVAVIGYVAFSGRESTAAKLAGTFYAGGRPVQCAKVGVISVAGGRSTLYGCTWEKPWAGQLTTTVSRCAVWIDGAAYDVTKEARASSRLTGDARLC